MITVVVIKIHSGASLIDSTLKPFLLNCRVHH